MQAQVKYCGFWKRVAAHLLDQFIIGFALVTLLFPFLILFFGISDIFHPSSDQYYISRVDFKMDIEMMPELILAISVLVFVIFSVIIQWLYYAFFESSQKMSTPGKMILSLRVTDLAQNRISFAKASARYFAKIITGFTFGLGYLMAAFTFRKQTLHDMITGCVVIERTFSTEYFYPNYKNKDENV
ncbi:MAG: RDD family protein [Ignavibacteriales bacterium]|nr:RDD family protein [Ignavibacteriales bacterium]MCF8315238.1 RDD family protein [Ignavibacteriales bacterium]MCF8436870.1 RDD family protein [Ignavibacteriales bacterium]